MAGAWAVMLSRALPLYLGADYPANVAYAVLFS